MTPKIHLGSIQNDRIEVLTLDVVWDRVRDNIRAPLRNRINDRIWDGIDNSVKGIYDCVLDELDSQLWWVE